jgi:hypothetical protein
MALFDNFQMHEILEYSDPGSSSPPLLAREGAATGASRAARNEAEWPGLKNTNDREET